MLTGEIRVEYEKLRICERYWAQCKPIFIRILKPRSMTEMIMKSNIFFAQQKKKKRIKKVE